MLSLFSINKAPRREDEWGSGGVPPLFLALAQDRGEWSVSRHAHWIRGSVGSRFGLDSVD
jgi:hypothetical protein